MKRSNNVELKRFYEERLRTKMDDLEGLRLKAKKLLLAGFGALPVFLLLIILMKFYVIAKSTGWIGILVTIGVGGALFYASHIATKKYTKQFKARVVQELVKFVNPDWEYFPEKKIPESVYEGSKMFDLIHHFYKGDDLVVGKVGQTDFQSSELHTGYFEEKKGRNGKVKKKTVDVFHGLFFHADFKKHFSGITYVVPEKAKKDENFLTKLFGFEKEFQVVKLENPEFERAFHVKSTDQIEARYLITPAMMEKMVYLRKHFNCEVSFSFVESRVYCAIQLKYGLFEPNISTAGVPYREVELFYELFKVNELIINELDLNTRIWTKA